LDDVKGYIKSTGGDYEKYAPDYYKNNPSQTGDQGLINSANWYAQDLTRRMAKSNSFLDSTIGKVLSVGAQVAASFIPGIGPAVSAGIGAAVGGATGGVGGALLGGLSGYGIGRGTQFVAGGGVQRTFGSLFSSTPSAALPSAGSVATSVATTGGSLLSKVASVGKAAVANVDTLLSAANLGLAAKEILGKGAVLAGTALAANALTSSAPSAPAAITASPPPAVAATEDELQREKELRRRRITQTTHSWGNTLLAPSLSRPQLLGGATRLSG
jgi:hypothetical protein